MKMMIIIKIGKQGLEYRIYCGLCDKKIKIIPPTHKFIKNKKELTKFYEDVVKEIAYHRNPGSD